MTDTTVIHPKFHHVNLKTTRLQEMIDYYRTLVGAEVVFQDQVGAWLSNDGANHRVALLAFPNFVDDAEKDTRTGMHHSAFEYASFDELMSTYVRLRDDGITPAICLDHGMTFSYYYADPGRQQRRAAGRQLRRLGQVDRVDAHLARVQGQPDRPVPRPRAGDRRPPGRHEPRRDPRQGDGRRLRPRAGPRRDPGDVLMRLCRFDAGSGPRHGIVVDSYVVDREDTDEHHRLDQVRLLAPVQPRKFLAIGLNYADHIAESGMEAPKFPVFFNKQITCVVGPGDDVHMPRVSNLLDYEGELAVVIGARCRHVPEDRAHEVIAGYTITNDVSVRDWQIRTPTMTMGKSFDTHGPLGPWLVTPDELGDPHDLAIRTYVNDELRQDGNTREMIYNCFQQIAHLSEAFTLEPGDVIATGTPAGIGAVRQPFPEGLLKTGDVVRVQIDGIGELCNTVVEEPEGYLAPDTEVEAAWAR